MRELIGYEEWRLICDQCRRTSKPFRGMRGHPKAWGEFRFSVLRTNDREPSCTAAPPRTKDGRYTPLNEGWLTTMVLLVLLRANRKAVRTGTQRHLCPACAQVLSDMIEATIYPHEKFTPYERLVGFRAHAPKPPREVHRPMRARSSSFIMAIDRYYHSDAD